MYVTVLVWLKIQLDWKQTPLKYKTRKKKIDGNNGKEKVPRKSEKMPKYYFIFTKKLHYIYLLCAQDIDPNFFVFHQNSLEKKLKNYLFLIIFISEN